MINIPRRKQKIKYSRKYACKHLTPKGDISNSLQALCYCTERNLVLGTRAYVCETCSLYNQKSNVRIVDIYEESRKQAEKKIKEKKIALVEVKRDEDIDLSIDEFEEDELELPEKFEKRKAGKGDLEEGEEFAELLCPFCDEIVDDLRSHIASCDLAPDDASIEDIMPSKSKKKKRGRKPAAKADKGETGEKDEQDKQKCPYCGKEFQRLGRHLNSCKKRPDKEEEEDEEDEEDDEYEDDDEDEEDDEDEDEEDDDEDEGY